MAKRFGDPCPECNWDAVYGDQCSNCGYKEPWLMEYEYLESKLEEAHENKGVR